MNALRCLRPASVRAGTVLGCACLLLHACQPTPEDGPGFAQTAPDTLAAAPAPDTQAAPEVPEGSAEVWEQARLRGIDFRAVGQEPGWLLEIDEGNQITMLADYGERNVTAPAPEPTFNDATGEKRYDIETDSLRLHVSVRNQPCTDVMSGEQFPTTVVVTLDGREYRGCGRTP